MLVNAKKDFNMFCLLVESKDDYMHLKLLNAGVQPRANAKHQMKKIDGSVQI